MKIRMTALWTCALLVAGGLTTLLPVTAAAPARPAAQEAAQPNAGGEKKPAWKSRDEYDAFQKIMTATDPAAKINAAEAFLQKYPNSDFKDQAYLLEMQSYQQQNNAGKAMEAARNVLKSNPQDTTALAALNYLSFAFPFVFNAKDANAEAELAEAESYGKQGLELLQKLQKPPNLPEEQFTEQVKQLRANFNGVLGFVALQKKDYPTALTELKAALEDAPSNPYITYRIGLSYLYSNPPDINNAIWYLARAVSLAKAAKSPDEPGIEKFYDQVYVGRHGSDQGQNDVIAQAAQSVNPPPGFNVAPPPKHAKTGNPSVDGLYQIEDALAVGGDQAQQNWQSLKGQPLQLAGFVDSVERGSDPGTCVVRIDITPESRAKEGVYDIELHDAQSECKDLARGDPVRFQGTIAAYTLSPNFVLTLENGKINAEDLRAAAAAREAAKPKPPRHRTSH